MPSITYKPGSVRSVIEPIESLTELTFAVQATFDWFLGRGVWRIGLERNRPLDGSCIIMGTALETPGPCRISNVCTLGGAVKQGVIPASIPENKLFRKNQHGIFAQPDIQHGQHQVYLEKQDEAVLANQDLFNDVPIGQITLATASLIVGFFFRGVRSVRFQLSQKNQETAIKHNMPAKEFLEYLQLNESEQQLFPYDLAVSSLG